MSESSNDNLNITLDYITNEVVLARNARRDFSFSVEEKSFLVATFGIEAVVETLIKAIRDTQTPIIDQLSEFNKAKLLGCVERVINESNKEHSESSWAYKLGNNMIHHQSTLLNVSPSGSVLSTALNGNYRYSQRVVNGAKTPEENWNDDNMLKKAIIYNCSNPVKSVKEALSRNRIRVFCMQGNGCHYGTAFPISVVMWILKREAKRRQNGKLLRVVDPCAGWGDRLAGALISGKNVVEHYYGIDPWNIANESCEKIYETMRTLPIIGENIGTFTMVKKGAEDESELWPESDVVLICPPYGELECYNVDSEDVNDGQAWRLCRAKKKSKVVKENRFVSDFIAPMLRNAAKSISSRSGRIIINVANTKKKEGAECLTQDVLETAKEIGLVHVETFGMRLSVRAPKTSHSHGADVLRGEPFFVFELNTRIKII